VPLELFAKTRKAKPSWVTYANGPRQISDYEKFGESFFGNAVRGSISVILGCTIQMFVADNWSPLVDLSEQVPEFRNFDRKFAASIQRVETGLLIHEHAARPTQSSVPGRGGNPT